MRRKHTRHVMAFVDVDLRDGGAPTTLNTVIAFCRGAKCTILRPGQRAKRCADCLIPHPDEKVQDVAQRIARGEA